MFTCLSVALWLVELQRLANFAWNRYSHRTNLRFVELVRAYKLRILSVVVKAIFIRRGSAICHSSFITFIKNNKFKVLRLLLHVAVVLTSCTYDPRSGHRTKNKDLLNVFSIELLIFGNQYNVYCAFICFRSVLHYSRCTKVFFESIKWSEKCCLMVLLDLSSP